MEALLVGFGCTQIKQIVNSPHRPLSRKYSQLSVHHNHPICVIANWDQFKEDAPYIYGCRLLCKWLCCGVIIILVWWWEPTTVTRGPSTLINSNESAWNKPGILIGRIETSFAEDCLEWSVVCAHLDMGQFSKLNLEKENWEWNTIKKFWNLMS